MADSEMANCTVSAFGYKRAHVTVTVITVNSPQNTLKMADNSKHIMVLPHL